MYFDVIIIGGGAAGISAAFWCGELGLSSLLLEASNEFGGQLLWTHNEIKNHLGIEAENGREMRDIFVRQAKNRKITSRFETNISEIDLQKKEIVLNKNEKVRAKTIVIATGVRRRKLNVEGELKFEGKGIISSGKGESEKAEGKKVLIVGGGDAAFENAGILAGLAAGVILVHRGAEFRARKVFVEEAKENPKVKLLTHTVVREISGSKRIEAVELENLQTKKREKYPVEIVLIRIGVEPNTGFLRGKLELDQNGYIKIDQNCETGEKDIFAIGDVANPLAPTISSAVGMGATAAKVIFARLNS